MLELLAAVDEGLTRRLAEVAPAHAAPAAARDFCYGGVMTGFSHRCWIGAVGMMLAGLVQNAVAAPPAMRLGHAPPFVGAQPVLQTGHTEGVQALVFSPDGRWLASCDMTGALLVRDAVTGAVQWRTRTGADISQLAYAPGTGVLAAAGLDGEIRRWDTQGKPLPSLGKRAGKGAVPWLAIAFSPDGRWLASAAGRDSIEVWDTRGGTLRWSLKAPGQELVPVVFDSNDLLAAGSAQGQVWIWDGHNGRVLHRLKAGRSAVAGLDFWSGSETLVAACKSGSLYFYGSAMPKGVYTGPIGMGGLEAIDVSPDDREIAVRGKLGNVCRLDLAGEAEAIDIPFSDSRTAIMSMAYSPSGQTLATGTMSGAIMLRDTRTNKVRKTLAAAVHPDIGAIAVAPNGSVLALGLQGVGQDSAAGGIQLWDPIAGKLRRTFVAHAKLTDKVLISPDGKLLASQPHVSGELKVWDLPSGRLRWRKKGVGLEKFTADGTALVTTGEAAVRFWEPQTGKLKHAFQPKIKPVVVKVGPDGTIEGLPSMRHVSQLLVLANGNLATVEEDFDARHWTADLILWDGKSGAESKRIRLDDVDFKTPVGFTLLTSMQAYYTANFVNGLELSPDGHTLAVPVLGQLQLRDAATGELKKTLRSDFLKDPDFPMVHFTSDGSRIVTSLGRVWDVETGTRVAELQAMPLASSLHPFVLFRVPGEDSDRVAFADFEAGTVQYWDTGSGRLLGTTQLISTQKLKSGIAGEWITYGPDGRYEASAGVSRVVRWRKVHSASSHSR